MGKKVTILLAAIILAVVAFLSWFLFFSQPSPDEVERLVDEFNTQYNVTPTPPTTTGAVLSKDSTKSSKTVSLFELRQQLPLETDEFMLDYDYANLRYVATLKENATVESFWSWVDSSQYTALSEVGVFITSDQL